MHLQKWVEPTFLPSYAFRVWKSNKVREKARIFDLEARTQLRGYILDVLLRFILGPEQAVTIRRQAFSPDPFSGLGNNRAVG